jgi:O-antigen ligase
VRSLEPGFSLSVNGQTVVDSFCNMMSDRISTVFAYAARIVLAVTLVAAPWPFGSYPLNWQPWLFGGVLAALACWWISAISRPGTHSEGQTILVDAFLPPLLFLMLAAVQLVPLPSEGAIPEHAVLKEIGTLASMSPPVRETIPTSFYPAATRLEAARVLLAICAAFLGIQLYSDANRRLWLYIPIAINAAALAGFGIWQKLNWTHLNEMLFGKVPLRFGGQPFASFVNRNNAAGYLNMGLCAAAGWGLLAAAPRINKAFRRVTDQSERERPATERLSIFPMRMILAVAAAVLAAAGIIASASRGGVLGLIAAFLVALGLLMKSRRSRIVLVGAFVVLPLIAGVAVWFGFDDLILSRMLAIHSDVDAKESRLTHWQDTWGAVQDHPWLGGGLGAYRYINRPYQNHATSGWYLNADNQFFEWLVEMGLVGIVMVAAFLLMGMMDVRRLVRSRSPWEQRDAALMGGMLIASQGLQALTDFGIIVPANLLTAATLAGVLFGTAARALPFDIVGGPQTPLVFRGRSGALVGLVFAVGGAMAWWEVHLAAAAFTAHNSLPFLDQMDSLPQAERQTAIDREMVAAAQRPDDAELQRALGELLIYQYRSEAVGILAAEPQFQSKSPLSIWQSTALRRLLAALYELDKAGRTVERDVMLVKADPDKSLPRALDHFERASITCRMQPDVEERIAILQIILNQDYAAARSAIGRQAIASPGDPFRLLWLGNLALIAGDDEMCALCLQQSLRLRPLLLNDVLVSVDAANRNPLWILKMLPADVALRIDAAEQLLGTKVAEEIATNVEEMLEATDPGGESHPGWRGRLMQLKQKPHLALELFLRAIKEEPGDWQWYERAAQIEIDQKDFAAASNHLRHGLAVAPKQSSIQKKLSDLKKRAELGVMPQGQ